MTKRYFDFNVRMRVESPPNVRHADAQKFAKEVIQYQLDRQGHWITIGNEGQLYFVRITATDDVITRQRERMATARMLLQHFLAEAYSSRLRGDLDRKRRIEEVLKVLAERSVL